MRYEEVILLTFNILIHYWEDQEAVPFRAVLGGKGPEIRRKDAN